MSGSRTAGGNAPVDDWVASADASDAPAEPAAEPAAAPESPAALEEPKGSEAPAPAPAMEEPPAAESPAPTLTDADLPKWARGRIDQMTRKMREAQEQQEELQRRLAQYEQVGDPAQTPAADPAQNPRPAAALYTEEEVQRRAQQVAAEQTFNQQCSNIYETGKKTFSDWDNRMETIRLAGGIPPTVIEAAMESGDAHVILAGLAGQPDELTRLQALPPAKMGVAVAKFGQQLSQRQAAPKVSAAPLPPEGRARGTTMPEPDPDKMTIDEWMRYMDTRGAGRVQS